MLLSSSCVPLLQASEKMELTTLWERAWLTQAASDTPLSDWLEWLEWDSRKQMEGLSICMSQCTYFKLLLVEDLHLSATTPGRLEELQPDLMLEVDKEDQS